MFGLSAGKLFPADSPLEAGTVILPKGNAARLSDGDPVLIQSEEWEERAKVVLDQSDGIAAKDLNNIRSGKWTGTPGKAATYKRISAASARWYSLRRSTKAMIGGALALIAVALLFLNAALTKEGGFDPHLTRTKWLIFGLGVIVAFASWAKDNLL